MFDIIDGSSQIIPIITMGCCDIFLTREIHKYPLIINIYTCTGRSVIIITMCTTNEPMQEVVIVDFIKYQEYHREKRNVPLFFTSENKVLGKVRLNKIKYAG